MIAETLSADIEIIRDIEPRGGPFAFAAAIVASVLQRSAPIAAATKGVADYDVVLLGCPVWAHAMATPMRTYIMREKPGIKQVALFCTLGGSGGKATLARMAALCGITSVADLIVDQSALASGTWRTSAETFARQVQMDEVPLVTETAA